MANWRDTHPDNTCACGQHKSPESKRCRSCHMKHVHHCQRMRAKCRGWAEQAAMGLSGILVPGEGVDLEAVLWEVREVLF